MFELGTTIYGKTVSTTKLTLKMCCFVTERHEDGWGYTLYCSLPAGALDRWRHLFIESLHCPCFYSHWFTLLSFLIHNLTRTWNLIWHAWFSKRTGFFINTTLLQTMVYKWKNAFVSSSLNEYWTKSHQPFPSCMITLFHGIGSSEGTLYLKHWNSSRTWCWF